LEWESKHYPRGEMLNFCRGSSLPLQNFKRNLRENLVALVGASLTSQVRKVTPILPEILTSCPYNCWPLLLRMSVVTGLSESFHLDLAKIRVLLW